MTDLLKSEAIWFLVVSAGLWLLSMAAVNVCKIIKWMETRRMR
jgi:nitrate reductase NapE component